MTTEPLKQIDIWIHPKDLIELRKDIWNDEPVDTILKPTRPNHTFMLHTAGLTLES